MDRRRRPRFRNSRKAAASAVAVLFVILIVVALLNTYLATTLPQQMAEDEFQHAIAVQNTFVQLQSDILGEAEHPSSHVVVNTPIELQSSGEPPFGSPSGSTVSTDATASSLANLSYDINIQEPVFVNWTAAGTCGVGLSQNCTGPQHGVIYDNQSVNNSLVLLSFTGCSNGCNVTFNIRGNYDTIYLNISDNNGQHSPANNTNIVISGNHDTLFLSDKGSSSIHRNYSTFFYGTYDNYSADVHNAASNGINFATTFVGEVLGSFCPVGDLSATDVAHYPTFNANSNGKVSRVWQNVTWWHASGSQTQFGPILIPNFDNKNGKNPTNFWQSFNKTAQIMHCAFATVASPNQGEHAIGGFFDTLNDRYFPSETMTFEEGAVIAGTSPINSTMVSGPLLTITNVDSVLVVNLTLVQLVSNGTLKAAGGGTADIQTHLISTNTIRFTNTLSNYQSSGFLLEVPWYLTIVTQYPNAWESFFQNFPSSGTFSGVDGGVTEGQCYVSHFGPEVCPVVVPVYSQGLNVEIATVGISMS